MDIFDNPGQKGRMMARNNTNRRPPGMAPALEEAIPVANLTNSALHFAAAFARLDRIVAELSRAQGMLVVCSVAVEAPLFEGGAITYRVDLSGGTNPVTLHLDHQVFTAGNDYFAALAIPQLETAIDDLRLGSNA